MTLFSFSPPVFGTTKLVDVVVPSYNEPNIATALKSIASQTYFDRCNIIVADYDPEKKGITRKAVADSGIPCTIIDVDAQGIGYARKTGIDSGRSPYVSCFDSDTLYGSMDTLERLMQPLVTGEAVFTCCDNVFALGEVPAGSPADNYLRTGCALQRVPSTVAYLEPGLSFTRVAYEDVGGFEDVIWFEGALITAKMLLAFGMKSKVYVHGVHIITSARRAKAFEKIGFDALDYNKAIRDRV